ncbi:MAG: MBL fold metallo-hydrolase [Roseiflexaceae bacterium]|nr:MBL fold metallo-hydrolase [Roseiflexaceae bacterium]
MRELAPQVWMLPLVPPYAINAYLLGDVLVDAGVRATTPWLLHQLRGHQLGLHVLTHAHPDHQGGSRAVCQRFGIPLWCGAQDAVAMEHGEVRALLPPLLANRLLDRLMSGPAQPLARRLMPGDHVGDFVALATPGHTPGHTSFWRERDRVLILGDVLRNMDSLTLLPGLGEPYARFTCDIAQNRASIRLVAALRPKLICFGHGPPLHDPDAIAVFAAGLPV